MRWPWPGPNDLDTQTLPRYGQDVTPHQKWSFYVNSFRSYSLDRQTDTHTHTHTHTHRGRQTHRHDENITLYRIHGMVKIAWTVIQFLTPFKFGLPSDSVDARLEKCFKSYTALTFTLCFLFQVIDDMTGQVFSKPHLVINATQTETYECRAHNTHIRGNTTVTCRATIHILGEYHSVLGHNTVLGDHHSVLGYTSNILHMLGMYTRSLPCTYWVSNTVLGCTWNHTHTGWVPLY